MPLADCQCETCKPIREICESKCSCCKRNRKHKKSKKHKKYTKNSDSDSDSNSDCNSKSDCNNKSDCNVICTKLETETTKTECKNGNYVVITINSFTPVTDTCCK